MPFPFVLIVSLIFAMPAFAGKRFMPMLDDDELTNTSVDYLTEINLEEAEDQNQEKTAERANVAPDISTRTPTPASNTTAPISTPIIPSSAPGVTIQMHSH